ncbi:MAG: cytochrome c nitrite reductase small subunit [Planctomycetota bacterium]
MNLSIPVSTRRTRIAALSLSLLLGVLGGLGFFTFGYGEGHAYLSNNPESCANCHVMQAQYDSWQKSSHHATATCNDCHLSHHPIGKWITKADNGFFHSLAFTTGEFKDPIQIKPRNSRVVQAACIHCHKELINHMLPVQSGGDMLSCVHCHADVGHALASTPRRNQEPAP